MQNIFITRVYRQSKLNLFKRFCHTTTNDLANNKNENVRVRFAPSPTGI